MKDIMLKIVGKQITYDQQDEDQMEFVTEGKMYEKNGAWYIVYEESEVSGQPGCKTSLKFKGETVRMKRFAGKGGRDTVIEFEKGRRFAVMYDTPFGGIEMEVLTNSLENNLDETGRGSVSIDYDISLKGLSEGRSLLSIEILN